MNDTHKQGCYQPGLWNINRGKYAIVERSKKSSRILITHPSSPPIEIVRPSKRKGAKILCLAWHNSRDSCQFVLSRNQSEFCLSRTLIHLDQLAEGLCRSVVPELLDSTQHRLANIYCKPHLPRRAPLFDLTGLALSSF